MKRIVREVNPFTRFVKMDNPEDIWEFNIKDVIGNELVMLEKQINPTDTINLLLHTQEARGRIIEQITFEQALAWYADQPISMIKDGKVYWLEHIISAASYDKRKKCYCPDEYVFIDTERENEPAFTEEELIDLLNSCQLYQSESWSEFYEHDLPTLIRMAREGV